MKKKGFTELSPTELILLIVSALGTIIAFIILYKAYNLLANNGPDESLKASLDRLTTEIDTISSNLKNSKYDLTSSITVPIQMNKKFAIVGFQKDSEKESQCNKKACLCIANKKDLSRKYFCKTFEGELFLNDLIETDKDQIINVRVYAIGEGKSPNKKITFELIPIYLNKPDFEVDSLIVSGKTTEEIYNKYHSEITNASEKYKVPKELIIAIISAESSGNPFDFGTYYENGVPRACGAVGLMQVMPDTAKKNGIDNVFDYEPYLKLQEKGYGCNGDYMDLLFSEILEKDVSKRPYTNELRKEIEQKIGENSQRIIDLDGRFDTEKVIDAGTKFISTLLKNFNGSEELAIASYNAGSGAVKKNCCSKSICSLNIVNCHLDLPEETRNYVPKVIAFEKKAQETVKLYEKPISADSSDSNIAII